MGPTLQQRLDQCHEIHRDHVETIRVFSRVNRHSFGPQIRPICMEIAPLSGHWGLGRVGDWQQGNLITGVDKMFPYVRNPQASPTDVSSNS